MSLMSLPKMFVSEREGWPDVVRLHPSTQRMFWFYVVPLSLIPPLMYVYAQMLYPGAVFPMLQPPLSAGEAFFVGVGFFLIELGTVALMGAYIRQLGDSVDVHVDYGEAYTMAAIAPTPLWLSALALFVPSAWFGAAMVAIAWVGSVALIRHGVRPLFRMTDDERTHRLANSITATGVGAWICLLLVLALLMSIAMGWR